MNTKEGIFETRITFFFMPFVAFVAQAFEV